MQRETLRQRQLEFLQLTANPIDMQIIGPKGRANVLRAVSHGIGLDGEEVVPSEEELEQQQKQAMAMAQSQGIPGHATAPPEPKPGLRTAQQQPRATQQMGPITNTAGPRVTGGVG
jgi:hypothetical protein